MGFGAETSQSERTSFTNRDAYNYGIGESETFIDPSQQPYMEAMRSAAMDNFYGMPTQIPTTDHIGHNALNNLYESGDTQPIIDARLTGLQSGLNEMKQEGLNAIGDNAIQAGAFGGARHGLSEAALGGEIASAYTKGYGDIMAQAQQQAMQSNQALLQGMGNFQQARGQEIANYLNQRFGGLNALQGIIGAPTILQRSSDVRYGEDITRSESRGTSESAGMDFGAK